MGSKINQLKYNSKARVLVELEVPKKEEITKAGSICSAIAHLSSKETNFNEMLVLLNATNKQISTMEASIVGTGCIIGNLAQLVNMSSTTMLTGITALVLSSTCSAEDSTLSVCIFVIYYTLIQIKNMPKKAPKMEIV